VTLGLSRNQSVRRIKGNQATLIIHNGIILDLVCRFGGSVGGDVRADFPPFRGKILLLLSEDSQREEG